GTSSSPANLCVNYDTSGVNGGGMFNGDSIYCYGNLEVKGNTASGNGGGIYQVGDTLYVGGTATVIDNKAGISGGGVSISQAGAITIKGVANIKNNQITGIYSGGGVYINNANSALHLDGGGWVNKNISGAAGGGILVEENAILTVGTSASHQNLVVDSNVANGTSSSGAGGGLYNKGYLTCYGNFIDTNNTASASGGGFYNMNGTMLIYGTSVISNNKAMATTTGNGYGGGFCMNGGTLTCKGAVTVFKNLAKSNYGGGIYLHRTGTAIATINFEAGAVVKYNSANNGGGIYITSDGARGQVLNVGIDASHPANLIVNYDTARTGHGGGIANMAGAVNCYGNLILDGNVAANCGGGLINGSTLVISGTSTITNNVAAFGGGIFVDTLMDLRRMTITNNTATSGLGGGVFVNDNQNAGDYAAVKYVNVGGEMTIKDNTAQGVTNNLYVQSRNNIHLVETFASTSQVGVFCVRSTTAYPAYGSVPLTIYGMRDDDLFAKAVFTGSTPIVNEDKFINDITNEVGVFTSTNHIEAGGYPSSPAPAPVNDTISKNRKATGGTDNDAVKWKSMLTPLVKIHGPVSLCNGIKDTLWVEVLRSTIVSHEWGGITQNGTPVGPVSGDKLPINTAGTYWVKSEDNLHNYAYDTIRINSLSPSVSITHSDVLCYGGKSGSITQGAITGGGTIQTAYWVLKDISGRDSIDSQVNVSGKTYNGLIAG
ncbi:MAG: hypothetical protein J5606_04800, partial [Bacteroidales bacterium]|nr:hypothetical protein [Bacteroidales bacterium]